MNPIAIAARNITRAYGSYTALHDVTLDVADGEFVSLVGPSGCGKTTLLRILGGFDHPTRGKVMLAGRDVTNAPPERRATNMVFQRGALFPHLTAAENIAYPLKRSGTDPAEIARRVEEMLALIRLVGFGHRLPAELSGGQAQRVALARALVGRPRVLLLDEPFSALDLALRKELQLELKRIHRQFACAFVFVTHDQEEALVLSDRIALMKDGRILQEGSPTQIYREPTGLFAAQFIGDMNLLAGVVRGTDGPHVGVEVGASRFELRAPTGAFAAGDTVFLSIRPENVELGPLVAGEPAAMVDELIYAGSRWRVRLSSPALPGPVWAETSAAAGVGLSLGQRLGLRLDLESARLLRAQ